MEKQLLLALLVLGFSSYDFAKPNEEPTVNGKYLLVNTDQGSTNESVSLVKEDENWKVLKNRNVKRGKTQKGYRQIGLFGNIASTHSYRTCENPGSNRYHNCMWENAKMDQQNMVALTAKVFELTKRYKVFNKRLTRLSRLLSRKGVIQPPVDDYY